MNSENVWNVKVGQARQGSEESVSWLTQQSQERVRAYIYRVTLDNDLSDDLTQDTLLQMIKSIRNLKEEENFWPWMYRIAQSKVQEHYRNRKKDTSIAEDDFYKDLLSHRGDIYQDESLRDLLKKDLLKKVMVAMKELKQKQRAVLSLRCFDNLSYAEIADTFNCNEVTARILFYRARKALRKKLSDKGISGNMMIMSLGLFGRLTLSPEASATIPGEAINKASLKVGPGATILGNIFSKKTAALIGAAIILFILLSGKDKNAVSSRVILPQRNEVFSLHFTMNFQNNNPGAGSQSRGAYEQWYYFPEGVEGPMYMRMQRWDPNNGDKLCTWLNNEHGNYYYDPGARTLYQWNRRIRWASLKVRRLPSDSVEFSNFISKVEGELPVDTTYERDEETGMLVSSVDHRLYFNAPDYLTKYEYNTLDKNPFVNDFPFALQEEDLRDEMHKRGWTYFNIEGELDGKQITGKGRIPFIYDTCKEYPAWLSINVGNEYEIVDCSSCAYVRNLENGEITMHPAGTFFRGLSRPWTGLHSMDAVRRDAIEQRVWYFTELSEDKSDAIITLYDPDKENSTDLVYTIDVEHDIVEEILVTIGTNITGMLKFSYLNDINNIMDEYIEPVVPADLNSEQKELPGILWITNLSHGRLVK